MAQRAVEPFYVKFNPLLFETRSGLQSCFYGADEDEDENDEDEENDEEDESGSEDTDNDENEDDEESEADKVRKRLKAADKNNSALQKKIKELEDKDKDEKTKATERVSELESENAKQAEEISGLRLQNSFLVSNTYAWDDPEYALDFAQRKGYLDDVVDEDDGSVDSKALSKALDRLAKDKPNFLKEDGDTEDKERQPGTKKSSPGARKKEKGKVDEAEMRRRFPAAYR